MERATQSPALHQRGNRRSLLYPNHGQTRGFFRPQDRLLQTLVDHSLVLLIRPSQHRVHYLGHLVRDACHLWLSQLLQVPARPQHRLDRHLRPRTAVQEPGHSIPAFLRRQRHSYL